MKKFCILCFHFFILGALFAGVDSSDAVEKKLVRARQDLALAEAALAEVTTACRVLEQDPSTSPEQLFTLEEYRQELHELVKVRRRTLHDLQEMAGINNEIQPDAKEVQEGMDEFERNVSQVPDAREPKSEAEKLEQEFQDSLADFDGRILDYEATLEDKMEERLARGDASAKKHQSAAEEAEALLRSMGVDTGEAAGTDEKREVAQQNGSENETDGESVSREGGDPTENQEGVVESGPRDRGGPQEDEDIVARQLREAAEKETDPVLREKLWQEYEAYLDSQS